MSKKRIAKKNNNKSKSSEKGKIYSENEKELNQKDKVKSQSKKLNKLSGKYLEDNMDDDMDIPELESDHDSDYDSNEVEENNYYSLESDNDFEDSKEDY